MKIEKSKRCLLPARGRRRVAAIAGKAENADKTFLSVATASTGGTYYPMGVGLANVWSNRLKHQGIQVTGQSSAGSIENIDLLQKTRRSWRFCKA